jgi:hypothetical protein
MRVTFRFGGAAPPAQGVNLAGGDAAAVCLHHHDVESFVTLLAPELAGYAGLRIGFSG